MTKERFITALMAVGISSGLAAVLWFVYAVKLCTDAGQPLWNCMRSVF